MLGISKDTYTDLATNETKDSIYLRLYLSAFKSGLVAQLPATEFKILMVVCSYMNEAGECFPTQEQIAERSGFSKTTVNKAIKFLLEFEFNGKTVLNRDIVQRGYYKNSIYKVNPISQVAIFNGGIEAIEERKEEKATEDDKRFKTAKDVGTLYLKVYHEVYGVQANINYARDYSQVKNKWLGKYSDEQIQKMIEVGVKEYDTRWKNGKFPRPSLSALVSWIGEQALGLAEDGDKEFKEVETLTSNGQELNNISLDRLKNRINK
jgi:hypothetical protein